MRKLQRLPTDTVRRKRVLERRSSPTPGLPRLADPVLQARLDAADAERAKHYARQEDICDRLERVAEAIDESSIEEDGAVIDELSEEDSLVHHISALAVSTRE